jgi:hypothetical protein
MTGSPFRIPSKTRLSWLAFETTSKKKGAQESTEKGGIKWVALGTQTAFDFYPRIKRPALADALIFQPRRDSMVLTKLFQTF